MFNTLKQFINSLIAKLTRKSANSRTITIEEYNNIVEALTKINELLVYVAALNDDTQEITAKNLTAQEVHSYNLYNTDELHTAYIYLGESLSTSMYELSINAEEGYLVGNDNVFKFANFSQLRFECPVKLGNTILKPDTEEGSNNIFIEGGQFNLVDLDTTNIHNFIVHLRYLSKQDFKNDVFLTSGTYIADSEDFNPMKDYKKRVATIGDVEEMIKNSK